MTAQLAADLRNALSPDRVRTNVTELGLYRRDASNLEGSASVVCFPVDTAEVQAAVRLAGKHGVPFVARGAGTGLAGGAVPLEGALVIATTKMDRLLSVDTVNRTAWVEPGLLNLDLAGLGNGSGLHRADLCCYAAFLARYSLLDLFGDSLSRRRILLGPNFHQAGIRGYGIALANIDAGNHAAA